MLDIHDPSNWPALGEPHPEYVEILESFGGVAPELPGLGGDVPSMREAAKKAAAGKGESPIPAGLRREDRVVKARDGYEIPIRVYAPTTPPAGGSPLGIVLHGGGLGGLTSQERICRMMALEIGMTVVNVDYRLAPEYKHPTGLMDCWDVTKWVAANASSLGADPSKGFTIGGSSAGGNMSCVISHLARDEGLSPKLTGCHLMNSLICSHLHFPEEYAKDRKSWDELANAGILNHKANDFFMDNVLPNRAERGDPLFSPFLWKTGHKGLPPHFFQVCGGDPLRDESLIYERRLREEDGVKTRLEVYAGLPHGFYAVFPQMKATEKFLAESIEGLKWILSQNSTM